MRRARRGAWVVGMVLGIVAPAAGYDLTGTWEGRATCTSLFEGAKHKFADAPSIRITQTDDALGLRADYGNGDVDFYVGVAYPDAKKPDTKGELGLVACGTDDVAGNAGTFDEVGRFSVTTKVGAAKATVRGLSFFSDPGIASPEAGTCKWKLTRVDTLDGAVPTTCAALPAAVRVLAATPETSDRHRRGR